MFGDIFLCQFPFTSGAASKLRPALVLFDLGQDAVICRLTGVLRTGVLDVTLKISSPVGMTGVFARQAGARSFDSDRGSPSAFQERMRQPSPFGNRHERRRGAPVLCVMASL